MIFLSKFFESKFLKHIKIGLFGSIMYNLDWNSWTGFILSWIVQETLKSWRKRLILTNSVSSLSQCSTDFNAQGLEFDYFLTFQKFFLCFCRISNKTWMITWKNYLFSPAIIIMISTQSNQGHWKIVNGAHHGNWTIYNLLTCWQHYHFCLHNLGKTNSL